MLALPSCHAQPHRARGSSTAFGFFLLVWIFVKCWRRLYKQLDGILRVSRHPSHSLILCFTRAHLEINRWMNIAMMWISISVGMNTSISPAGVARQQPVTNIYESLEYNEDVRFYHFAFPVNNTFGVCEEGWETAEKRCKNTLPPRLYATIQPHQQHHHFTPLIRFLMKEISLFITHEQELSAK